MCFKCKVKKAFSLFDLFHTQNKIVRTREKDKEWIFPHTSLLFAQFRDRDLSESRNLCFERQYKYIHTRILIVLKYTDTYSYLHNRI
jgi:hypothetical protein